MRGKRLADDQLGAAAADVHDESMAVLARGRVRDAEVDQARLFDAGDDFDRMTKRVARALEERAAAPGPAQRVGPDDAHAAGPHVAQPLSEALEAGECAQHGLAIQATLLVEAGARRTISRSLSTMMSCPWL